MSRSSRSRWGRRSARACTPGYIADGAIAFQIEGQLAKILKQGDAFHEPVNARMMRFDNASDSAPATFIAFYLLRPGEDRLIEMLQT
jgi:quercetin dioxygenase-like cupin family protein